MNLIRFKHHPASLLSELMEDFDKNIFSRGSEADSMIPAVNIRENEEAFMLDLAAPGMKKEDFKINLDNNVLSISSEKKHEEENSNEKWTRRSLLTARSAAPLLCPRALTWTKSRQTTRKAFWP